MDILISIIPYLILAGSLFVIAGCILCGIVINNIRGYERV